MNHHLFQQKHIFLKSQEKCPYWGSCYLRYLLIGIEKYFLYHICINNYEKCSEKVAFL